MSGRGPDTVLNLGVREYYIALGWGSYVAQATTQHGACIKRCDQVQPRAVENTPARHAADVCNFTVPGHDKLPIY